MRRIPRAFLRNEGTKDLRSEARRVGSGRWAGGGETTQPAQLKEIWELGYEQEQSFTRTFQIRRVKGPDIHKSGC